MKTYAYIFFTTVIATFSLFSHEQETVTVQKDSVENFIETPKKTKPRDAKRIAVEELEDAAYALTKTIAQAAQTLDAIMRTVRDISEGNNKSPFMKTLQIDRNGTIAQLTRESNLIRENCHHLNDLHCLVSQGILSHSKK